MNNPSITKLIKSQLGQFMPYILFLIMGIIAGYGLRYFLEKKKYRIPIKIESCVMWVSLIVAILCLILACSGENQVSTQILSFYASFVFSWLLTKINSQKEFAETQHKIAKSTYRHIEDVEVTVLITRDRLYEYRNREESISRGEVDGIIDDINAILTGIQSNKEDWKDMLKKNYKKKLDNQADPEGKLDNLKKKWEEKAPDNSQLKKEFQDDLENSREMENV